ncbi:MAG: endonuclease III domain-containing protein [Methanobrevibacter sp.]|jgi:endonuclease-3 related protein|nr:endonuclease III domain-containing protein [Candidatus Methanoflexus mossambicus]
MKKEKIPEIYEIYNILLKEYGSQGWWPLINILPISNIENKEEITKYHPKNYDFPENDKQQFEIILGTILTQNTNWKSVEKSLIKLNEIVNEISAENILKIAINDSIKFKEAIKSSRYANQKYNYILNITNYYIDLNGKIPKRKEILEVKGIGNETADSILLYGYKQLEFVVDAYTRRIFSNLGYINEKTKYMEIKKLFESNIPQDFRIYQEYHSLIVEHAKRYYIQKPYGKKDKLLNNFKIS